MVQTLCYFSLVHFSYTLLCTLSPLQGSLLLLISYQPALFLSTLDTHTGWGWQTHWQSQEFQHFFSYLYLLFPCYPYRHGPPTSPSTTCRSRSASRSSSSIFSVRTTVHWSCGDQQWTDTVPYASTAAYTGAYLTFLYLFLPCNVKKNF